MLKNNKGEGLGSGLGLFPFVLSWPLLTRDAPDFNYTEYEVVMSDEQQFFIPIKWFHCGELVSIFVVYHILLHYCINLVLNICLFLLNAGLLNYAGSYYSIALSII